MSLARIQFSKDAIYKIQDKYIKSIEYILATNNWKITFLKGSNIIYVKIPNTEYSEKKIFKTYPLKTIKYC